jgi:hypothetical protein
VQRTAAAYRATLRATETTRQNAACAEIYTLYSQHGQTFDPGAAKADPEAALIEWRLLNTGNPNPGLSSTAPQREASYRQTLATCLGLPLPSSRHPDDQGVAVAGWIAPIAWA